MMPAQIDVRERIVFRHYFWSKKRLARPVVGEVDGGFVRSGKYCKHADEWELLRWAAQLPPI